MQPTNTRTRTNIIVVAAIIIVILAILGLYKANNKVASFDGEPIKIGGISALTGVGVAIGEEERKGAALAVDEINSAGGVLGRPLKLISEDVSIDKIKTAVAVAQKLISVDKVVAIVGPEWDEPAYPILPIIEASGVPTIGPDSSPMLESEHDYTYFFSTWYDNRVGIRELLRYAKAKGLRKIAIIKPISAGFWEYTARIMTKEAPNFGVTIVDEIDLGNPVSLDFKTVLLQAKQKSPDAIFAVTSDYNQCTFLKQARQIGYDKPTLGTESSGDPTSLSQCTDLLENRYFSTPVQTDRYKVFAEKFKTRYGEYPKYPSSATAYDAVMVIVDGLKRSNLKGGAALRDAIKETKGLRGAALDPLEFDKIGFVNTPESAYEIQTVKNGEFMRVDY